MDERRNRVDDDEHHNGERVDAKRPFDPEPAGDEPGREIHELHALVRDSDLEEGDPGEQHGEHQEAGGDDLAGARADHAPERTGDEEAEKRQEDNR